MPSIQFMDAVRAEHDANNDMQLTQKQAILPIGMNAHIAVAHAHHWDIALAAFPPGHAVDHPQPGAPLAAILAALVANWELLMNR